MSDGSRYKVSGTNGTEGTGSEGTQTVGTIFVGVGHVPSSLKCVCVCGKELMLSSPPHDAEPCAGPEWLKLDDAESLWGFPV